MLRTQPYKLGKRNSFSDTNAKLLRKQVSKRLQQLRERAETKSAKDSPLFDLLPDWDPGEERGEDVGWLSEIIHELDPAGG